MYDRERCNQTHYQPHGRLGHYESWFQRANHPTRPLAFWIRYTIFSPRDRPEDTLGELWAIYFDGETHQTQAIKQRVAIADCQFATEGLDHRIGDAQLDGQALIGKAQGQGHDISWDLHYQSPQPPLLLLPEKLYEAPFPKAKSLVGSPLASYTGTLHVDGQRIAIEDWVGSQNHNWGSKHTDRYAWGQVAGFDEEPDAFLEITSAQLRVGPLWSPRLTLMVLRVDGEELRLNSPLQALRAHGTYEFFSWRFSSKNRKAAISGRISAPRDSFIGLPYDNPPGGVKTCLNSKLASCSLRVERPGRPVLSLHSQHRAAFEILTESVTHGVPVLAQPAWPT